MNDEWFIYKIVGSLYSYLLVQEDEIMLRLTSTQARKLYELLKKEFDRSDEPIYDRT